MKLAQAVLSLAQLSPSVLSKFLTLSTVHNYNIDNNDTSQDFRLKQAELGVPHSKYKLSGPDQNVT